MKLIRIIMSLYIICMTLLISSLAFDPSIFEDEEFEQERMNTRFDPSIFEDEEFEQERMNTRFDHSIFEDDEFQESNYIQTQSEPGEAVEYLIQSQDNMDLNTLPSNSQDSLYTSSLLYLAGYGIIVIALTGIVILYAIHFFRRKRGEN